MIAEDLNGFKKFTPKTLPREEPLVFGHRACQGCGEVLALRMVAKAIGTPMVVVSATGCMEIISSPYPQTAWAVPWIHVAFENAGAVASGVEAGLKILMAKGRIPEQKITVVVFAGDGGTADIGLQSLSGALERGHDFIYVCLDNEAYMNTGIQRSGATPKGAHTTTAPSGKVKQGKEQQRKDLTAIMAAHEIPYVAQAAVGYWNDYVSKVQKAVAINGPTFINIIQPCRLGWGYKPEDTMALGRLAVETCIWPIYEVINGEYKISMKPKEKKPVAEFFKPQVRFKHLFKPENAALLEEIQAEVDQKWAKLLKLAGEA